MIGIISNLKLQAHELGPSAIKFVEDQYHLRSMLKTRANGHRGWLNNAQCDFQCIISHFYTSVMMNDKRLRERC